MGTPAKGVDELAPQEGDGWFTMGTMNLRGLTRRKLVTGVLTGALLVGGGTALGMAVAPAAPSASGGNLTAAVSGKMPGRHRPGWLIHEMRSMRSADHGTVQVKRNGAWVTLTFDRGTLASSTPASIVVARPDGQSVTLALTPTTHFRGAATSRSALVARHPVFVISEGGNALTVVQPRPHPHQAGAVASVTP